MNGFPTKIHTLFLKRETAFIKNSKTVKALTKAYQSADATVSWCGATDDVKTSLVGQLLSQSSHPDHEVRSSAWGGLAYIAMGRSSLLQAV